MGETGKPGQKQKNKLYQALIKGITTTIIIDDKEVQKAWGNQKGTYKEIAGSVLPITMNSEKFIANGYIADSSIKILDFTPFMRLAISIGHVTEWDKKVLQLYTGRKTERYWNTLHFLIREIGWMRNKKSKRSNKILYSNLYTNNGDKSTRDKQLTRDMLYRLLDEVFKETGYISSYKEDSSTTPGVILTLNQRLLPGR
jgi:hypothetical protein